MVKFVIPWEVEMGGHAVVDVGVSLSFSSTDFAVQHFASWVLIFHYELCDFRIFHEVPGHWLGLLFASMTPDSFCSFLRSRFSIE